MGYIIIRLIKIYNNILVRIIVIIKVYVKMQWNNLYAIKHQTNGKGTKMLYK